MLRDLFSLFPAYAGVILLTLTVRNVPGSFPRIRGGDPQYLISAGENASFSPHTRG